MNIVAVRFNAQSIFNTTSSGDFLSHFYSPSTIAGALIDTAYYIDQQLAEDFINRLKYAAWGVDEKTTIIKNNIMQKIITGKRKNGKNKVNSAYAQNMYIYNGILLFGYEGERNELIESLPQFISSLGSNNGKYEFIEYVDPKEIIPIAPADILKVDKVPGSIIVLLKTSVEIVKNTVPSELDNMILEPYFIPVMIANKTFYSVRYAPVKDHVDKLYVSNPFKPNIKILVFETKKKTSRRKRK